MAFGFGFNKQKLLSAAEKFVQQGKLQNAIAEYDKVLKHDEKDLTVNNTIGDLYARLGDSAKAIECFKKVGDAYAAQGFTVKGIAMYKKITKLHPSVDSSLKLAELYTQQGLFNDARAQYLQVAEDFMKNGDLEQAVRLFQKVLEMDPENVPMRVKLAEVYVRLDKKKEAWEIFSAVVESLRSRGSLAAVEDILKRMLAIDPNNSYVLLLRGKSALDNGDPKSAIANLEKAADLDSHPDGLRDLLKAYLLIGNLSKATPISEKLLTVHNDAEGMFLLGEGSARLGQYHEAIAVYTRHADRLLATDSTKLLGSLHSMITHVRNDSWALDALLLLLNKAGENTHVNEVTELLAHASVEDGNLARARDLYQTLATTEPQNPMHMQNYQQVAERMGESSPASGITAEEGALLVEELEATAPVIDQSYPDSVAIAVRSAVTDADLFLSYNLPEKALVPLLAVLPQAPSDARLNQRLAALHTRFHRFAEAAVCCRNLESVYHDAGFPDEAMRYGELAARYEKSAESAPLSPAAPCDSSPVGGALADAAAVASAVGSWPAVASSSTPAPWPMAAPAAKHENATAAPAEFDVSAMTTAALTGESVSQPVFDPGSHDPSAGDVATDLSSEWEDSLSLEVPAEAGQTVELASANADAANDPEIAETIEEIRFYLEHFMAEQAYAAFEKLETLTSDAQVLAPLRSAIASAKRPADEPEAEITEIEVAGSESSDSDLSEIHGGKPADFATEIETQSGFEIPTSPDLMAGYDHGVQNENHVDSSAEVHQDGMPEAAPEVEPQDSEPVVAMTKQSEEIGLPSFVADLEASLGDSFPLAPPVETRSPAPRTLQGWPAAVALNPAGASVSEPEPVGVEAAVQQEVVSESVAQPSPATHEIKSPDIPSIAPSVPAITASAAGAATAAAPAFASSATADSAPTGQGTSDPAISFSSISYSPAPVRPLGTEAQGAHAADSVDLSEMFGELKQELEEERVAGDDDPETHYNLGVAFREMGLLDEAIAEFQKVCTAIDRGKAFGQPVQTYTWLAQCFLDKGIPEAAIRWYEKALNLPGLDEEGRVAINYELGSACESAQDRPAALRHFTEVYSANIDYRDVAERIQALKS